MNPIVELFTNISDDELKTAIEEIIEFNNITCVTRENGILRKYQRLLGNTYGINSIDFTIKSLNEQAAFRWLNQIK